MEINRSLIITGEKKPYPNPVRDPKVTLAYGNNQFSQLGKKCISSNKEMKLNTLKVILNTFKTDYSVAEAMNTNLLDTLFDLINDADVKVKAKSISAISAACNFTSGRRALLVNGDAFLNKLIGVLNDSDDNVRAFGYNTLLSVSNTSEGKELMVNLNYVPLLIKKINEETTAKLQALALNIIANLIQLPNGKGSLQTIEHGGMVICIVLLDNTSTEIAAAACKIIELLSFKPDGRIAAIKEGAIPNLLTLICDTNPVVRNKSSGALMLLLIDNGAKDTVLTSGGCRLLIDCLSDKHRGVRLNTCHSISNISSNPGARSCLREGGVVQILTLIISHSITKGNHVLAAAAQKAKTMVEWNP